MPRTDNRHHGTASVDGRRSASKMHAATPAARGCTWRLPLSFNCSPKGAWSNVTPFIRCLSRRITEGRRQNEPHQVRLTSDAHLAPGPLQMGTADALLVPCPGRNAADSPFLGQRHGHPACRRTEPQRRRQLGARTGRQLPANGAAKLHPPNTTRPLGARRCWKIIRFGDPPAAFQMENADAGQGFTASRNGFQLLR